MTREMDRAKLSAAAWKIIANQRIGSVPVASGNILANDGNGIGLYVFSMLHLPTSSQKTTVCFGSSSKYRVEFSRFTSQNVSYVCESSWLCSKKALNHSPVSATIFQRTLGITVQHS
ncbi:hypothetical protein NPIL_566441 [Nephila pilipes]|uniref:Uncharacterized protein n=1 Tax=Nephila pilipes TaxID=299642 RepID=A0A8X6MEJ8_NEPPI|nr:hypothetical protein NPIL_566441 [Nephila pilipes]